MRAVVRPIAMLAASAWLAAAGCSKPAPAPPLTCRQLQEQAVRCRPETLALVKARLKANSAGAAADVSEQQYRMFEIRYNKKIQSEAALSQCERFKSDPSDDHKKQLARMTACGAKTDCAAFSECFLGL
jgi:hypothetical protein